MFSLVSSDGVECRRNGEHAFDSGRLRVVVARWSEFLHSRALLRDAEAQHWLGSDPATELSSLPLIPNDPLVITADSAEFIGIEPSSGRLLAHIGLTGRPDGVYDIGGLVDPAFRGQGFGREALQGVCRIAHHHFGIMRLRAGCEATNVVSARWLASCGFVRVDGPAEHVLPNGRTISSLWWERVDDTARRRCRRGGLR